MKKVKFFIPFALLGLLLSGCANASALKDNYTDEDRQINTPWEDFVLPATGIEFADGEESIELVKGETHTYAYSIQPNGATSNTLSWFSENENVATVSNGVVTAVGGGQTTIIASSLENAFDQVELAVKVNVPIIDFALQIPERLERDERYNFDVTFDPVDTTDTDLQFEIVSASPEGVARVSADQEITTGSVDGTATLKVTSAALGADKAKTYTLNIDEIEVESITLSTPENATSVEVNHGLQFSAAVTPANASALVKNVVKFYSKDTDKAVIDEVTGVATGVGVGTARIYAQVGTYVSNDFNLEVFKVYATSVAFTTADFTLSNHNDNGVQKQLEYEITTDHAGLQPSSAQVTFVSADPEVVTVSDTGLVTAVGAGSTTVRINVIQEGQETKFDDVAVTVDLVSTALVINGNTSFYNDESLTLSAVLTPAKVNNMTINWSVEPAGVVVLSAATGASVTLTPADEDATGAVTVTATNVDGASSTKSITLLERNAEFTTGNHYIVGNTLLNTGVSTAHATKTSWESAKYAYHFTNRINNTGSLEEFKGTIYFNANDEFNYRVGSANVPNWEQHEGWAERGYHIEQTGENNAFTKGHMVFVDADNAQSHIKVVAAGWYDLYAKLYKNTDGSTWYALYIQKVPAITVDVPELTMGLEGTYQIVPHDYIGEVEYSVTAGADVVSVSATGLIAALGVAGVATIKVSDSRGNDYAALVHVTVKSGASGVSRTIYLNANGHFDQNDVTPYVHSWKHGVDVAVDTKMTKVAGQTIIYEASIPVEHDYVIFARSKDANTFDWGNIYNQTNDLAIPEDKDMFKHTGYDSEDKVEGVWEVFDSTQTYEIETEPRFIHYENGSGGWIHEPLVVNPGNDAELMGSVTLTAGTEFYIQLDSSTWRHWSDIKDGSAAEVVQGTTDPQNFKASVDGTYTVYVKVQKENESEKTVYIGFSGGTPLPENNVLIYFCDVHGWDDGTSAKTMSAYVWKGTTSKADWPGEPATYVGLDNNDNKVYSYTVNINAYDHIIFVAGTNQTDDIDISAAHNEDGFQATTVKSGSTYNVVAYTYVPKSSTPETYTVSFNANGGTGDMAAIPDQSGSYTLPACTFTAPGGKEFGGWKANNAGDVLAVGASYALSANVEFYAVWVDSAVPNNVTIYLTNNWWWSNLHAYAFDSASGNHPVDWPGTAMTYVGINDDNDDIYSVTVDTNAWDRLIITNNAGGDANETVALDISSAVDNDAYYFSGRETPDDNSTKAVLTKWGSFTPSALTSKTVLYFTNNEGWGAVSVHMFDSSDNTITTTWPGIAAKKVAQNEYSQDIYRFLVDQSTYDTIIINNNDNGVQTVDIVVATAIAGGDNAFYISGGSGTSCTVGTWKYTPGA